MDESVRLLTLQQQLEKESDGKVAFFGQSVNETITTCLVNGMAKRADKIKSDFKVPDKWYAPDRSVFKRRELSMMQILVREAPCLDRTPRLRSSGRVRPLETESHRV